MNPESSGTQSNETNKPAPIGMSGFFTRERANEGVVLPLALPDGTPTKHWIRIRGVDSDAFKEANARLQRTTMEWAAGFEKDIGEDKIAAKLVEGKRELLAALIISWSFPDECNRDNAVKFLTEAPQIGQEIDALATKRKLFFALSSTNSAPTPAPSSG
jgi:hypothetical protein